MLKLDELHHLTRLSTPRRNWEDAAGEGSCYRVCAELPLREGAGADQHVHRGVGTPGMITPVEVRINTNFMSFFDHFRTLGHSAGASIDR